MKKGLLHPGLLALALAISGPALASPSRLPVHPGSSDVHMDLIRKMQSQGAWFASLAHIEAHRQEHGDNPALRLAEADALRQTGQAERARRLYAQLLKTPYQAAAHNGLGLLDATEGHLQKGIVQLRRASALAPLNVDYLNDLGYALMLAGQHAEARFPLAQAIELSPGDKRIISNVALWHLVDGKEASATAIISQGGLPESTQLQIHALAQQLKLRHHAPTPPVDAAREVNHVAALGQQQPVAMATTVTIPETPGQAGTVAHDDAASPSTAAPSMTGAKSASMPVSTALSADLQLASATSQAAVATLPAGTTAPDQVTPATDGVAATAVVREPLTAAGAEAIGTQIDQLLFAQDWVETSHQWLVDAAASLAPGIPEATATPPASHQLPAGSHSENSNSNASGMPIRAPLLEFLLTSVQQGSAS